MMNLYQLILDLLTEIDSKDPCVATFHDLEKALDSKIIQFSKYYYHKNSLHEKIIPQFYSFLKNRSARIQVCYS